VIVNEIADICSTYVNVVLTIFRGGQPQEAADQLIVKSNVTDIYVDALPKQPVDSLL
jgi:hypothetical protein